MKELVKLLSYNEYPPTTEESLLTTTTTEFSTTSIPTSSPEDLDDFIKGLLGLKNLMKPSSTAATTKLKTTTKTTTTTTSIKIKPPAIVTRPARRPHIRRPGKVSSPLTTSPTTTTQLDIVELLRTLEEQKRQEKQRNSVENRLNVTAISTTTTQTTIIETSSQFFEEKRDEAILHFGNPEQERIHAKDESIEDDGQFIGSLLFFFTEFTTALDSGVF